MNINRFNAFVSTLKELHDSDMQHVQHSKYSESIYSTVFNELNVDIVYKKMDALLLSICNIQFKTKDNQELFKVHFLSDSTNNHATYGYQSISIDNIVVRNSKLTEKLLQSIGFDDFVEHQYHVLEKEIAEKKAAETSERSQFTVEKLLHYCDNQIHHGKINIPHMFAHIRGIQESHSTEYLFDEVSDPEHHLKVKTHSAFINDLHIEHQIVPSTRGSGYHHTLTCSTQDIHFSILMVPKLSKYSTDFYQMNVGNDTIKDTALINQVIASTGIDQYLDKTFKQIKVYEKVEAIEKHITEVIRETVTQHKANAVIQLLNGEIVNRDQALPNPAIIENAKVWTNENYQLHRKDGPAIENYEGLDLWFKNGKAYIPENTLQSLYEKVVALNNVKEISEDSTKHITDKKHTLLLMQGMKEKFAHTGSDNKHSI